MFHTSCTCLAILLALLCFFINVTSLSLGSHACLLEHSGKKPLPFSVEKEGKAPCLFSKPPMVPTHHTYPKKSHIQCCTMTDKCQCINVASCTSSYWCCDDIAPSFQWFYLNFSECSKVWLHCISGFHYFVLTEPTVCCLPHCRNALVRERNDPWPTLTKFLFTCSTWISFPDV